MRDRTQGKQRRDRERHNELAKGGPSKPARDKRLMRVLDRDKPTPLHKQRAGCKLHPEKARYGSQVSAERYARLLTMRHGKPLRPYECLTADGGCGDWHLTSKPEQAAA